MKTYTPEELEQADHWATQVIKEEMEKTEKLAKDLAEGEVVTEAAKDMLASIKVRLEEEHGGEISDVKLERLARSSAEWKQFRQGQFAAMHRAVEARLAEKNSTRRCRSAERHFEAVQSGLSYRKKEMERISG